MRAIIWIAVSSGKQAEEEKESLPEQKRKLLEVAEKNEWTIVDTIVVPGHSRVYYNFREFCDAALEEKIDGPMRMFEHWKKRDFDVLACIDGSRFGREQSIFAEVVARTIDCGAELFTLKDGAITSGNRRMFVSMAGYSAATEIDELVRRRQFGMKGRAQKGLKVSAKTLYGYREIRNEKGEVIRQEPDPGLHYTFLKVAQELLEGTSWNSLEKNLYEKHGITNPSTSKPYGHNFFRSIMCSPTFWGHTAMNYTVNGHNFLPWIYDEAEIPPEEVMVWRNTHPPMYEGSLLEAVQHEIRRRSEIVSGRATGNHTHRFSGLVVCGECGAYMGMVIDGKSNYQAMRCQRHYSHDRYLQQECNQRKNVNVKIIELHIQRLLKVLLEANDPQSVLGLNRDKTDEIERLRTDLLISEESMNNMVIGLQRVKPTNPAFDTYTEQIEQLGIRIQKQRQELASLESLQKSKDNNICKRTLEEVKELTLDKFWQLQNHEINQRLYAILTPYKLVALNGDIIKLSEYSGRKSRGRAY